MKNFLRISLFVLLLVGGAFASKIWATREFTAALSPFDEVFQYTAREQTASVTLAEDLQIGTTTEQTVMEDNFSFVSPIKNAVLYQGCTYPISWAASTTIHTIGLTLFDAGTRKEIPPEVSNMSAETEGVSNQQTLWNVGARVWPGEYFFQLTSLNNTLADEKSYRFRVEAYPADEQVDFCD